MSFLFRLLKLTSNCKKFLIIYLKFVYPLSFMLHRVFEVKRVACLAQLEQRGPELSTVKKDSCCLASSSIIGQFAQKKLTPYNDDSIKIRPIQKELRVALKLISHKFHEKSFYLLLFQLSQINLQGIDQKCIRSQFWVHLI